MGVSEDGRISYVKTPVLKQRIAEELDIFRVYQGSSLFVSDQVVRQVKRARLFGLTFKPVLASE